MGVYLTSGARSGFFETARAWKWRAEKHSYVMPSLPRVELITLGDELLLGIRENGHLAYLGGMLAQHGLEIARNLVIRDDYEEILGQFREAWESADVVITTGGLGPTSDDNTREAVAEVLGVPLEYDPLIEESIQERFKRMGNRTMNERERKQCFRLAGAEVLVNRHGTAPGMYFRFNGKTLVMLPGPATELKPMFEREVLPRLRDAGVLSGDHAYLQIRTYGISESTLEEGLRPVLGRHPGLGVAYCAHQGLIDVRVSAGERTDISWDVLRQIGRECRDVLGEDFVCCGNAGLAAVVFEQLRALEKTLAVAESCTGGLLSNAFTDLPGVSKVFRGGVVCYNNDAKMALLDVPESILQQHGAVSAETAVAMVMGAAERFEADYALSVTGFAGPGGGTAENPVGTVYMGYQSPVGVWSRKFVYPGDRLTVKARAVNAALDWMRRKLNKYKVEDMLATLNH